MCRCNHFCIILFVPLGERVKGNLQILTFGALRGAGHREPLETSTATSTTVTAPVFYPAACIYIVVLLLLLLLLVVVTRAAPPGLTRQHVRFASPQQFVISKSASFSRQTKFERDPLGVNEFREDVTMELEQKKPRP